MLEAEHHLKRALDTALAQYAETMGEAFPVLPVLDVVVDPELWALAEMDGKVFRIHASSGSVDSISALWTSAFLDDNFYAGFGKEICVNAATMTHVSLVWLMLHEMHHYQMGHFENLTQEQSSRTSTPKHRALLERIEKSSDTFVKDLIFEMQADHDATEMLLDAYSSNEWASLRVRVAAISAMMMLIERTDASSHSPNTTHPKAATRIFQLLGHLIDMPLLSAHLGVVDSCECMSSTEKFSKKKEQEHFVAQVVVPAFFDTVSLAKTATAQTIIDDLGSVTEFFHDIQFAKLNQGTEAVKLLTTGAQQWRELVASGVKLT
ncbi:hypothetical protein [Phaeobacter sp. 11ANDIMAR09]|uniref:hypothetical protein n=1 Tax=Phaeobacter sp. 11ANDIMAR09 TaxID=1225647 RepID=UPI0006C87143|nr:hypothetical protein [Phaeobacter sp. 11ANDIMAR09]KPD13145.1 hypothetical protein AN476_07585 [Phaeobacter sp. 11ANDIMAR09]